ncbi:hypothetical protein ACP0YU_001833 [Campylobacter jejuni]|nr:hypothetical protein [Campylobacter coli]
MADNFFAKFVFGWTIIVWLVCLIWSFTGSFKQTIIIKEKNEK